MTGETKTRRTRRHSVTFGWAILVIGLIFAGLYAALPTLVAANAPALAARFGLTTLQLHIGYPQLRGLQIIEVELAGQGFSIHGKNAELGFTWRELLKGQVSSLAFETLAVSVSATEPNPTEPPTATTSLLPASPLRQLSVEQLHLDLPDIGFSARGGAVFSEGVLSLSLKGLRPDEANRFTMTAAFSYDGVFSANFGERGGAAQEFLTVQGRINDGALSLQGHVSLADYALAVASALASLPQGEGTVVGRFHAQLPWPLPNTLTADHLKATLPDIAIDWSDGNLSFHNLHGSMAFNSGELLANLAGQVISQSGSTRVEFTLPPGYPISYQTDTDTVAGGPGLHSRIANADTRISATVQSFTVTNLPAPKLTIATEITGSYGEFSAVGKLSGSADLADGGNDPKGSLDFTGVVATATETRPANIQADYQLAGDKLTSAGRLSSGVIVEAPFEFDYNLATTAGHFNATGGLDFQQPLLARLLDWNEPYDLDSGQVDWSLQLTWANASDIAARFDTSLKNASAHYDEYYGNGISGDFEFHSADATSAAAWQLMPTTLIAEQVAIGMPIENLSVEFGWAGKEVAVRSSRANLLGGRITVAPFIYDLDAGSANFDLQVDQFSIAEVLALEGDDVSATGALSGTLPVVITANEVSITDGQLTAAAPGGVIRVSSALASLSGQPGLDFALAALQDFNYSELTTTINYSPNGDLALGVGLKGHNLAVEGGRPIHYNLNISENIPVLLESLRVQDQVTDRVEKQVLR